MGAGVPTPRQVRAMRTCTSNICSLSDQRLAATLATTRASASRRTVSCPTRPCSSLQATECECQTRETASHSCSPGTPAPAPTCRLPVMQTSSLSRTERTMVSGNGAQVASCSPAAHACRPQDVLRQPQDQVHSLQGLDRRQGHGREGGSQRAEVGREAGQTDCVCGQIVSGEIPLESVRKPKV